MPINQVQGELLKNSGSNGKEEVKTPSLLEKERKERGKTRDPLDI